MLFFIEFVVFKPNTISAAIGTVFLLVIIPFSILVGIAILEVEGGGPMWTLEFWRLFTIKILYYIPVSVVVLMIVGSFFKDSSD